MNAGSSSPTRRQPAVLAPPAAKPRPTYTGQREEAMRAAGGDAEELPPLPPAAPGGAETLPRDGETVLATQKKKY
ncbi:hypothetical protein STCU_11676 [Strigomonas culicis]|uniref:Uncharacterized protein n=1 Tax=Strigomonas culicis TaxID=28005 RepID=S9UMG8_9TRYP|nr:hypothetical protein STCU_11676 [Strigomonas culicis]|eukprot:EPY15911.1 hypothetical protein STCU_11676 [Strigomonas culicis]